MKVTHPQALELPTGTSPFRLDVIHLANPPPETKKWPQVSPGPLQKFVSCRASEPLPLLELQGRLLHYDALQHRPSEFCKARS